MPCILRDPQPRRSVLAFLSCARTCAPNLPTATDLMARIATKDELPPGTGKSVQPAAASGLRRLAGYHSVGTLKPASSAWYTETFLYPETGSQHMTSNYPATQGQAQLGCGAAGAQSTHGGCSCDLGCMYCDSGSQQRDPACNYRGKVCLNMCRSMRQPMRRYNKFSLQRCAMRRPTMFLGRWSARTHLSLGLERMAGVALHISCWRSRGARSNDWMDWM